MCIILSGSVVLKFFQFTENQHVVVLSAEYNEELLPSPTFEVGTISLAENMSLYVYCPELVNRHRIQIDN
jgi:hypothetical protein